MENGGEMGEIQPNFDDFHEIGCISFSSPPKNMFLGLF
jgi:hypothetical protein